MAWRLAGETRTSIAYVETPGVEVLLQNAVLQRRHSVFLPELAYRPLAK